MADGPKKLVTWKQWAFALGAVALGACLPLYRELRDTGAVRAASFGASAAVFCVGLGIVTAIFWYANRPERGEER